MIQKEKNGATFYQFPNLEKYSEIRHGIFSRNCGFSKAPFHSLNVGDNVGDNKIYVDQNRQIISTCMGCKDLVFLKQVHKTDVVVISEHNRTIRDDVSQTAQKGDALVSGIRDIVLLIQAADCQPILLFDPVKKVISNIHSGWRGSINNIIGRTLDVMKTSFVCNPGNIIAGVGPSLGPCCSEFIHYKNEIPKKFWDYKDGSDHFNFWAISRDQLEAAGVPAENIHISKMCTKCNSDLFFSYRKEKKTGRFAAVIGLV